MKQKVRYLSGVCQSWSCLLSHSLLALPPHSTLYVSVRLRVSAVNKRHWWIWRQERVIPFFPSPHLCLAVSAAIAEPLPWFHLLPDMPTGYQLLPGYARDAGIHLLPLSLQPRSCTDFLPFFISEFPPWTPFDSFGFHPWIKFSLCKIFKFSFLNPEWYKISPYPFYQFF